MRRVLASVAAAATALVGAIALAGPSTAQDPPLPPAGTITLKTGNSNSFTYAPPIGGSSLAAQVVRNSGTVPCNATTPGFIAVTGIAGTAALPGDPACFGFLGFGVGPGGSPLNLRPNTDAVAGEALVLTLARELADFEFASFTLDIEAMNAPLPAVTGNPPELVVEVRDSANPSVTPLQSIPVQLDVRVPNISLPNFRVPVTAIANPGDQLVLRPQGNIRFQLEGDTNDIGSIFKLTDVGTIPAGGDVVLEDESGATATIINPSGDPVPYVQQQCLPSTGEECVEFKLLGGDFYRLTVFASVPVNDAGDQNTWDGLIDFGSGTFALGQLSADCVITPDDETPQACITQFFYPDPKDGSGNPALEGDTTSTQYRTDVWDLYVQDPRLR